MIPDIRGEQRTEFLGIIKEGRNRSPNSSFEDSARSTVCAVYSHFVWMDLGRKIECLDMQERWIGRIMREIDILGGKD